MADEGKAIVQGELKLEPVLPHADCTDEYKEVFNDFFETIDDDLFKALNIIKDSPKLQKRLLQGTDYEKKLFNLAFEYLQNNIKVMALNSYHEWLSIDELRFGIKINRSPAGLKLAKSSMAFLENFQNPSYMNAYGIKMIVRYVLWLGKQDIKIEGM